MAGGAGRGGGSRLKQRARSGCHLDRISGGVDDDVQTLVRRREDEIAHEQVECRFTDLIWVLTLLISLSQPLLTERVRNIQDRNLVGDAGLTYHGTRPAWPAHGVCREIEDNRKILP